VKNCLKARFVSVLVILVCLLSVSVASASPFTLRPTSYIAGWGGYAWPLYAYDNNLSTASSIDSLRYAKGANTISETWLGFASAPPGASEMQLHINSAAASGEGGTVTLFYSLDGGVTYQVIYRVFPLQSRGQQTDTITLSSSQDLTKVRVQGSALVFSDGTFWSSAAQSIYEIWITGTD
jgi:hypothetical protein